MSHRPPEHERPQHEPARYECLLKLAAGGMATVFVGRLRGKHGFSRLVAIKRAHPHLLEDETLCRGLIAEARIASCIHHPNVVSVVDVEESHSELMLVMDYVEGASFARLMALSQKAKRPLDIGVTIRVVLDTAVGLHAAHALTGQDGEPLDIVHRDVSPQNILIGVDGLARIADFGIAKWSESTQATAQGLRGKLAYMAPEYIARREIDRRADIFALGAILWEGLTNERLFRGEGELDTIQLVMNFVVPPPSTRNPSVSTTIDAVVLRALARDPTERYATANEFAVALESAAADASLPINHAAVADAVNHFVGEELVSRKDALRMLDGKQAPGPISVLAGEGDLVTLTAEAPVSGPNRKLVEPTTRDTTSGALSATRLTWSSALVAAIIVTIAIAAGVIHRSATSAPQVANELERSRNAEPLQTPLSAASSAAAPTASMVAPAVDTTKLVESQPLMTARPSAQRPTPLASISTVSSALTPKTPSPSTTAKNPNRPGLGY